MKQSRAESEIVRALGKLAAAGFAVAPAETAAGADGELPTVTVYAVTDPLGAVVRLTPRQIRQLVKVAL